MIVIPAIIAGAGAILKPILIAAGIGALFGAGTSGVGEAVTGIQEHGTFNREVAANTFHAATQGAAEGALIGGRIRGGRNRCRAIGACSRWRNTTCTRRC